MPIIRPYPMSSKRIDITEQIQMRASRLELLRRIERISPDFVLIIKIIFEIMIADSTNCIKG